MNKVNINCTINCESATFEDAVYDLVMELRRVTAISSQKELMDEYHHWDVENEGDVDWFPYNKLTGHVNSAIHVQNV